MQHHPIFERFRPYFAAHYEAAIPPVNEEYFEWIDLLESVRTAKGPFTMVELGAGQGRWGLSAARAAVIEGMHSDIIFVEAEPQHFQWLDEAVDMYFGEPSNDGFASCYERVIAYGPETVPFYIHKAGFDATNWWGQYAVPKIAGGVATDRIYHGKVVFLTDQGDEYVEVETVTLAETLASVELVDLVDMDLQGAELDVIRNDMGTLNAKVRKVHIGTHGTDIENFIRVEFGKAGWAPIWDYRCGETFDTAYGPVRFQDGVQTWINPNV